MNKINGQLLSLWIESKKGSLEWKLAMGLILESSGKAQLQLLNELAEVFEIKIADKVKA